MFSIPVGGAQVTILFPPVDNLIISDLQMVVSGANIEVTDFKLGVYDHNSFNAVSPGVPPPAM